MCELCKQYWEMQWHYDRNVINIRPSINRILSTFITKVQMTGYTTKRICRRMLLIEYKYILKKLKPLHKLNILPWKRGKFCGSQFWNQYSISPKLGTLSIYSSKKGLNHKQLKMLLLQIVYWIVSHHSSIITMWRAIWN